MLGFMLSCCCAIMHLKRKVALQVTGAYENFR